MDMRALEDVGMTGGEIKVYLALIELGPSTAGQILKKANMQNSAFHFCVNRLIGKGIVSYIKKGKIRVYKAADPNNILTYVRDKEKEIEKLLPILKEKQSLKKHKEEVEIFEGFKGIVTVINTLIEDAKSGDEFLFFSADVLERDKEIQKFYKRFDVKRKSKGLISKGIAPELLKSLFSNRKYLKMKYAKFSVPPNSAICNDQIAIISWGETPMGILIKAKVIADKQREFFYGLWKLLK